MDNETTTISGGFNMVTLVVKRDGYESNGLRLDDDRTMRVHDEAQGLSVVGMTVATGRIAKPIDVGVVLNRFVATPTRRIAGEMDWKVDSNRWSAASLSSAHLKVYRRVE